MCSVQGCDSWRRGAEYFDLPKDPQIRLQWIQFVSDSNNGQLSGLLNELSCADITVCREHFLEGCFEKPFETYCKVQLVRLKSSAVPTVRIKEEDVAALQQVPCETESSNEHTQCIPSGVLQQGEQKPPVNNNIVSELFPNTCPSCGHNLQTTTITQGMFITLNQLCLTCDYRNEFRREISASADEHLTPTENLEVTKKEEQTDEYTCESDTFGPTKDIRGTFKEEKDSAEVPDQAKELHPEKDSEGKSRGKRVLDRPLTQQFCNDSGDQRTEPQAIQEKPVINENCLFRFFPHQCPSCSSKLQTEKVTVGTLITLTQQCLQCEYRNEFTRQTCATVSTTENQSSTPQSEPKQTDKLNNSETFELYKEESEDLIEEDSDEDWFPVKKPVPTKKTIEPCIQTGVLHQDEDKPPVNNNFVSELFPNTCRSCGYNLQTTSITEGMFITLTQQCPRCKYRVEFREINKSADESKTPTQSLDVTIKEEQTDEYICDTFGPTEDECGAFKTVEKSCESVATSDDLAKQQLPEKDSEGKSQGPYICNDPLKTEDDLGYPEIAYKTELEENLKRNSNENCLSQFFSHKCPSCSGKLQTENVTVGTLNTLIQQCLQCEYQNEFTRETGASTTENQSSTLRTEVTIEPHQTDNKLNNSVSETFAFYKEESGDPIDEEQRSTVDVMPGKDRFSMKKSVLNREEDTAVTEGGGIGGDTSSDFFLLQTPAPTKETDSDEKSVEDGNVLVNSDEDTREGSNYIDTSVRRSTKQLCNECGYFCHADRAHICEHKLKPYACDTCGKRCFTKISLKLHCLVHDNSKIHTCKYCFAPFQTKMEKLNHQKTHDDSPYPFQCPACPARFICFIERRDHMRTHPEPKQHKCEQCGITFTKRHVLFRHMVVHTGHKPFKCTVCERGFNQAGHLKSHMRVHSGEKPYKCQRCDKSFNHNVSLKSHIQRYHSNTTDKISDSNDTQSDSCDDNEKDQDTPEEDDGEKVVPKTKKWLTGRPKGRPKQNCGKRSDSKRKKGCKSQMKKQHCDKESEEELTDSNSSADLEEKEDKESKKTSRKRFTKSQTYIDPGYIPEKKVKQERLKCRRLRKGRGKTKL